MRNGIGARITTISGVVIGLLQLLLVFAILHFLGGFSIIASDYKYQEVVPGQIAITEYQGQETQVVIPSVIDDKSVTSVISLSGTGDRRRIEMIESIMIPDRVTSIADNAFDFSDQAVIRCSKDSFAYDFASRNEIKCEILE